jgi:hypothetical protein
METYPSSARLFRRFSAVLLVALVLSVRARAAELEGVSYTVEPIVGYSFERKSDPARSKLVLTYGARVIAGYRILSAEAEYTQGKSEEAFPTTFTTIDEKTERMRVGLRSTFGIGEILDWHLRGGGEAQKRHRTTTVSGVSTESDSPSKVYPYVGTGLELRLGSVVSLNASAVATLKDLHDMKQNEYSTTLGFGFNLNAR